MTFHQAAMRYSGLFPKMSQDEVRIRSFCNSARKMIVSGKPVTSATVDILVHKNVIANADRGEILPFRRARKMPPLPTNAFADLLDKMFDIARVSPTISHDQYKVWKCDFFKEAGFKAEVVFNRLVFTLFPEQFCSVSKRMRLCDVAQQLIGDGLIATGVAGKLRGTDWFTLCDRIMPAIKHGFPTKDFAYCSAFVAAVGVVTSR